MAKNPNSNKIADARSQQQRRKSNRRKPNEARFMANGKRGTFNVYFSTPADRSTVGLTFPVGGTVGTTNFTGSFASGSCTAGLYDGQNLVASGTWSSNPPLGCTWGFRFSNVPAGLYTLSVNLADTNGDTGYKTEGITVSQSPGFLAKGSWDDVPKGCSKIVDATLQRRIVRAGYPILYQVVLHGKKEGSGKEEDVTVVVYERELQRPLEHTASGKLAVDVIYLDKDKAKDKDLKENRVVTVVNKKFKA